MKPGLEKTAEQLRQDIADDDPYALALQTMVRYSVDRDYGITEDAYRDALETIQEEQRTYSI